MTVVFFGSSDYCLPVLEALHKNFYLALVVTRPDKPVGRKQILTPSAVKLWAQKEDVNFVSPTTLKKDTSDRAATTKVLTDLAPDLAVVSDYGLIIPEGIFKIPKLETLNIHFSRLPELRGPSPVQTTLLEGRKAAWITIFKLENPPELEIKMDSGPIFFQKSYPIDPTDTTQTLYTRLFQEVARELPQVVSGYAKGLIKPRPQDHSKATFCHLLSRDDGFVKYEDLGKPQTYNVFRAMTPWPGLWTIHPNGKRMKILKCHLEGKTSPRLVGPGPKLVFDQIQFEGKIPQPRQSISSPYPKATSGGPHQ